MVFLQESLYFDEEVILHLLLNKFIPEKNNVFLFLIFFSIFVSIFLFNMQTWCVETKILRNKFLKYFVFNYDHVHNQCHVIV